LALANVVAFFYKHMFHGGSDWRVRLKIADGFHFAVGGNQAANGSALDCGGANSQGAGACEDRDKSKGGNEHTHPQPSPALARGPSIRIVVGSCQLVIF
jgi:hypothetical protein